LGYSEVLGISTVSKREEVHVDSQTGKISRLVTYSKTSRSTNYLYYGSKKGFLLQSTTQALGRVVSGYGKLHSISTELGTN
jgi:hypothetical protein